MRILPAVGIWILLSYAGTAQTLDTQNSPRQRLSFDDGWKFHMGDDPGASTPAFNDKTWRSLDLPHDWSIEGDFSQNNSTGQQEAGLPAGVGWYRKTFRLATFTAAASGKQAFAGKAVRGISTFSDKVYIDFDGVYRNSEVYINGHLLGRRPYGYISFRYDLTPWLKKGADNVLAVRVDNSTQPNSRWYTGTGIYRHVWLETLPAAPVAIDHWGTFITTGDVTGQQVRLRIATTLRAAQPGQTCTLQHVLIDSNGNRVTSLSLPYTAKDTLSTVQQDLLFPNARRWSPEHPYLYTVETSLLIGNRVVDRYTTRTGIRTFQFDLRQGFLLNGRHLKIKGVCLHHDLGALGAAVNTSAMRRQLQILKDMGCNAIRTAHNPPAPEFLDLCDEMGFLVMDEAFDMWQKKKNKYDYSLSFPQWHRQDLEDMIRRDRNHPSVFIWSIGNEIHEQFDKSGISLAKELTHIIKSLDPTRPVTSAMTEADTLENNIYQADALDVMGLNYNQQVYDSVQRKYPGLPFLATETTSAEATRGHYDMPSDSIRHWPASAKVPAVGVNHDYTISAYDNVSPYWGSTHEETWRIVKRDPFVAGLFVWSGFDYLGEPTPYRWPARSSYFGIVDLAGFPKDSYYLYQSEWSQKPVLHLFPHWNWRPGQMIDVWAYYSQASEVELFLNGQSLGVRRKEGDDLHVQWRVPFEPGVLKAVSRIHGKTVLEDEIHTAGAPARIQFMADRQMIHADGCDLAFVGIRITDADGNLVPNADNELSIKITGEGTLAAMDNGYQADLESFRGTQHKAFNGLCLAIVRSKKKAGKITLHVSGAGLSPATLDIDSQ
ncbi:glycoside hydrolase family 2 TIM barrel-domain containing protein [Puia dinghuensis]|uniref:Beta-galactosidase n=1 Tax=Puia dinghuensis TaxID=1792502 RepID=A0A8J2UDA6_9BACT|nr:glycoside hydrolase family 2 TIM barrel-domain containing protein [Puia dinghuensis]GGB00141.1 beta-galactosidase [Puia dinghuensis]